MAPLPDLAAFVFDLDGCVYTGRALVPGVERVLRALRDLGKRILFLTNNSGESAADILDKLRSLGLEAHPDEVMTALDLLVDYLTRTQGPCRVLAIGTPRLVEEVARRGHTLVAPEGHTRADAVLVGRDTDFTFAKMAAAARAVAGGARFLTCNLDPRLPVEDGDFLPGCGAIVEAVAVASQVRPEVVGKPSLHYFALGLERLGTRPQETAMVGDTLATDIRGGKEAGMFTIWLAPPGAPAGGEVIPDLTIHSFAELLAHLGVTPPPV